MDGKDSLPSTSMTGWRAQLHGSIDTGGIPALAPDVTKLVVLTNSVRTWPDRFQLNRGADANRAVLFVS